MSNILLVGNPGCRAVLGLLPLLLAAASQAQAPLLTLDSPSSQSFGYFGESVSGVPDADGDGQTDLLVGARGEGGAHLFSGVSGAFLRSFQSPNPETSSMFGWSVSGVPDADGDGRGDVLVGAHFEDGGGVENAGRAYLYSGATGTLLHTLASLSPELYGKFGESVSGLADVDGDGRGDLLIGAPGEAGGVPDAGRVYVLSGASGALLFELQSPNAEESGEFGQAVSGVADVDGDGRSDLLVGASDESGGSPDAGRAYLFSGASGALLHTLTSPAPVFDAGFGISVAGVPDLNGDGRGDILVGETGEWYSGYPGQAYVFDGDTGAWLQTLKSSLRRTDGGFGRSVSGVPDVDGDGHGDLLVGSPFERVGLRGSGRAYLFSGSAGTLLRILTGTNPDRPLGFGRSVSGVADVDGDGRGDLLVGSYTEDTGGSPSSGRAYLFSGQGGVTLTASGSPTTISQGGTVTVTATVSNTSAQPAPLDLWVTAERSGNPVLSHRIERGTVPAGAAVTWSFDLSAPGNTPPGLYTVTVHVGRFPTPSLASDAFDVTVTGEPRAGALAAEPFVVATLPGNAFAAEAFGSSSAVSPQAESSASLSVTVSPNPFKGQTALRFSLAEASQVRLSVHDVLGREVAVLVDGGLEAGPHTAVFDVHGLASGVYVWRLVAGEALKTGRLTLLE